MFMEIKCNKYFILLLMNQLSPLAKTYISPFHNFVMGVYHQLFVLVIRSEYRYRKAHITTINKSKHLNGIQNIKKQQSIPDL